MGMDVSLARQLSFPFSSDNRFWGEFLQEYYVEARSRLRGSPLGFSLSPRDRLIESEFSIGS